MQCVLGILSLLYMPLLQMKLKAPIKIKKKKKKTRKEKKKVINKRWYRKEKRPMIK